MEKSIQNNVTTLKNNILIRLSIITFTSIHIKPFLNFINKQGGT